MRSPAPPPGWGLTLDPGLRRTDGDRVLIGGYPIRVLRLTPAGATAVGSWAAGGTVGTSAAAGRLAHRLVEAGLAHPRPPVGAGRDLGITLVVPTRDRPDQLASVLGSALRPGFGPTQTLPLPRQVIVVDDGSLRPGDVAAVARRFGAELIRHDHSQGPAAARNRGWQAATSEVVAFLDDDCRCPQGPVWAAALLDHLVDPGVALVAPRVRARRGSAPAWLAAYESVHSPLDMGEHPAPVRPGSPVPYVPAAALVIRRRALEEVGGFDPRLSLGEDVDLEWKLGEAGWSLRYEPSVVVAHEVREDLAAWLVQRFRYGTSAVELARRRPGSVAPVRLAPWTAVSWALSATAAPAGAIAGAGVAMASTAALIPRLASLPSPARQAVRLAGRGHWWAGGALARGLRRDWWPLLILGLLTRRGRRLGLAVLAVGAARHGRESPNGVGRLRFLLLAFGDDIAYGAGLWWEVIRRRKVGALLPALGDGPTVGRRKGRGQLLGGPGTAGRVDSDDVVDVGAPHDPS